MSVNELSRWEKRYLMLALLLDKLFKLKHKIPINQPAIVESYYGPEQLRVQAEKSTVDIKDLISMSRELLELIKFADLEDSRKQYLLKQIRAMETSARFLGGEEIPYITQVQKYFDISPIKIEEEELERAKSQLDNILPGRGTIQERMDRRRTQFKVPDDIIIPIVQICNEENHTRSESYIKIPLSQDIEIKLTSHQPWVAYNWFLGNQRSRIEFNTDISFQVQNLARIVAHEGFPGHHTERCLKEEFLYRNKGYIENSIVLTRAPEAVISEGIATIALEMIFQEKEFIEWVSEVLAPRINVELDIPFELEFYKVLKTLNYLNGNAAYLMYAENVPKEQVHTYIAKYRMKKKEEQDLKFILDPLWKPFIYNYTVGRQLVEDFIGHPPDIKRFIRLLTEQFTPSQLKK